ncbi:short-chain dehydrogenase/reductase, partial [Rhizobium ruizarguesonis]
RTELLTDESTQYAPSSVSDYDERLAQHLAFWKSANGQQSGDPAKLAQALITLVNQPELPRRFIAGADAVGMVEQKIALLQQQVDLSRRQLLK